MKENKIGVIIDTIGRVIIAIGLIGSLIVWIGFASDQDGLTGFLAFLGAFFVTFITGMLFIGFGEVIFLLQKIIDNTDTNIYTSNKEQIDIVNEQNIVKNNISILGEWVLDGSNNKEFLFIRSKNEKIIATIRDNNFKAIDFNKSSFYIDEIENEGYCLKLDDKVVWKIETDGEKLCLVSQKGEKSYYHRTK